MPDSQVLRPSAISGTIPLVFGIMLLWRLAPRGGWITRWPLSFIVGTFAGCS